MQDREAWPSAVHWVMKSGTWLACYSSLDCEESDMNAQLNNSNVLHFHFFLEFYWMLFPCRLKDFLYFLVLLGYWQQLLLFFFFFFLFFCFNLKIYFKFLISIFFFFTEFLFLNLDSSSSFIWTIFYFLLWTYCDMCFGVFVSYIQHYWSYFYWLLFGLIMSHPYLFIQMSNMFLSKVWKCL